MTVKRAMRDDVYTVRGSGLRFRVLSPTDLERIDAAILRTLETTGVQVGCDEAISVLRDGGADVSEAPRVRIPSHMVRSALDAAPDGVMIYSRDGQPAMYLGGENVYYGTGMDCPYVWDPYTRERRTTTKDDIGNAARIVDALPELDFVMCMGLPQQEVSRKTIDRHQFEAMMMNTTKPITFGALDKVGLQDILEMASIVAGGAEALRKRPSFVHYAEPISPLVLPKDPTEQLLLMAERRLPMAFTPAPMAGATTPATLAGTLVTGAAEFMAGLVIAQLVNPGTPYVIGGVFTIMDMKEGTFSLGSAPETLLLHAAHTELAHHYGLPVFSTAGASDAKIMDAQASAEAAASMLITALSGGQLIHDVGFLAAGMAASFELIVLCNDIAGLVRRLLRGIEVTDETLALDVVDELGPGGEFLSHAHTLRHFRNELWFPEFIDRADYNTWEMRGALRVEDRLNARVREILETHTPSALSDEVQAQVHEVILRREASM
jgi:trimethylamine--corrinoid protein Co-methyltransferase